MQLHSLRHARGAWSDSFPAVVPGHTLVLAFGAPELIDDPEVLGELAEGMPGAVLAGCSSAGEIHQDEVSDNSLSVAVAVFERCEVGLASVAIEDPAASHEVGRKLAARLTEKPGLRAVLVLSDGLKVNGTALARGLAEGVGEGVVVTGGLAADGARFERTWVLDGDGAASGKVVAVGLYGEALRVGYGSRGGWDPFGPDRVVTRARDNVLYELDGRPALELYKEYLGDRAAGLPATALLFPLALRDREGTGEEIVRTVLAVDDDESSMTFAGDIPEGATCRLMRANFERIIDGAGAAADLTISAFELDAPVLCVAVSCVGRRLVLGERTEEEVETCLEALPEGSVQVGFYSYGELSPLGMGSCDLHNQTMTLTALLEA